MRNMVVISDEVHRQAKILASRLGVSLAKLVEESLRLRLNQNSQPAKTKLKPLPVCHEGSGLRPGLSLDDMKNIYAAMGRKQAD